MARVVALRPAPPALFEEFLRTRPAPATTSASPKTPTPRGGRGGGVCVEQWGAQIQLQPLLEYGYAV